MKKAIQFFFLSAVIILAVQSPAMAIEIAQQETWQCGEQTPTDQIEGLLIARKGCCSWHGGDSGDCYQGRVVCNDGTLSPSCTCRASNSEQGKKS